MTRGKAPSPKLSRGGRLAFLWVAGGVLLATLLLHFWYFPRFGEPPSRESPRMAEGRVLRKDLLRDKEGRVVTRITYRFATPGGLSVEGQASLRGERWAGLRPGDAVRVLYSASDPRQNRLAPDGPGEGKGSLAPDPGGPEGEAPR
ncbi:MAG: DUF3592 domain-containing protein [Candidatus Tectomicrobia bacterium]|nr:DUF3592 domain-containing protein [Candidatus Tectomicrobia bacterium]